MIKPNWDIFKAKFNENPQKIFEWFCYLLFCKEFNKPLGVPGYQDHRHIETDPIEKNGEIIGWQAKFSELTLSSHKTEIIRLIEGAKKDYPKITKIIFYANKNWAQGKNQNDPRTKLEIDEKAKELGIEVDWEHLENFFESPFVSVENELIAKHFFSSNNSILDFINGQQQHTENILSEIKTCIGFNDNHIEISRDEVLKKLRNQSSQALILSGTSGVGKTALVKKFYEQLETETSLYVFKATEFELANIKDFFVDCNLQEFMEVHKGQKSRIIVIDSAEKLLDLTNPEPFKEFLTTLVRNDWNIVFTARTNYVEDLNYQFFEIYNVLPACSINLPILEEDELDSISSEYSFNLPEDQKLLELIRNPFYLNEYLKFYRNDSTGLDYTAFKNKLWRKNIRKTDLSRSECFLKVAVKRANQGSFFVIPNCNSSALNELVMDGMLGYEENKGFFITHDVYEEWALERNIEREYHNKESNRMFFRRLGQALPIRRSLRNWISEKLLLQDQEIGNFVEEVITDEKIQSFWKDEILVSILLSPFSDIFFSNFRNLLLDNNQKFIRKIAFLLRIACKEIDQNLFKEIGVNEKIDLLKSKYVLTKPKGHGWKSLIRFVYENLDDIGIENISFVLPVIHDWNIKFKKGETTKHSSLIALQYYKSLLSKDSYFSPDNEDEILITITLGAFEIKENLQKILEKTIENKWKKPRDPFYKLSETILKEPKGIMVSYVLPELVLQMIDLFCLHVSSKNNLYFPKNMYSNFNIIDEHLFYCFPTSPYRMPIYALLESAQEQTINFILEFTNKTVESFAKSDFARNEVEQIDVYIDETKTTKPQYICDILWCTYRGNVVSSSVLQSMHMALEKFFLEKSLVTSSEILECWLLYLLRKSKSSSISAVVVSIVLAYPEKTFNVARILFRTKEFFLYETKRLVLESEAKSLYSIMSDMNNDPMNETYRAERLRACDDKHRKGTLESSFLKYQFFRNKETSEYEAKKRQKILWEILDDYYGKLPPESEQTKTDEIWRLFLARMDRRKMKPITKETDEGFEINFNPQIDSKLKRKSEHQEKEISAGMKYIPLYLWSQYKWQRDEQHKQYGQYEDNPKLVLIEVKNILSKLKKLQPDNEEDSKFFLRNYSIPAKACSVLIRDYFNEIPNEEISFCKDVILSAASSSLRPNYQYQISDGVAQAIFVLPLLLREFPDEKETIKIILLLTLFDPRPIGMNREFSCYSVHTILNNLWEISFDDAQSILFGYLLLKPLYEQLRKKLYEENLEKENYSPANHPPSESKIVERFCEENKDNIEKFLNNELSIDDIKEIEKLELYYLEKVFQLIPVKTENEDHQEIAEKIVSVFAEKLPSDGRDNRIDYMVRIDFLRKLACFVLNSQKKEIKGYLKPFIDNFNSSEIFADLFQKFIMEQDRLKTYDNFWEVWNLFKEKVIKICKNGDNHGHEREIVKSYLFAQTPWEETVTSWHTLRNNDKEFFKEISREIGHCSSVIYSISGLLNGIGSHYLDDGMLWVSDMLTRNQNLLSDNLEKSTVYYMESFTRKYVHRNLAKIKESKKLKNQVLIVLDFLIAKNSVIGYMLRERII